MNNDTLKQKMVEFRSCALIRIAQILNEGNVKPGKLKDTGVKDIAEPLFQALYFPSERISYSS